MRVLRALDLLELFNDLDFQRQFLESEQAVDWFWLCYEAIIRERNKDKRDRIKSYLKWFIERSEDEKRKMELEKFLDVSTKITQSDIRLLNKLRTSPNSVIKWIESTAVNYINTDLEQYHYLHSLWLIIINQRVLFITENTIHKVVKYDWPKDSNYIEENASLSRLWSDLLYELENEKKKTI